MRLVSDWKRAHRWFSVQAQSLAVIVTLSWQVVPDDLRTAAPPWLQVAVLVAILVGGIAGRLVDQEHKEDAKP